MNDLLQLKGVFEQKDGKNKPGASNLPKDKYVTIEHLYSLRNNLVDVLDFWNNEKLLIKPLVSAYYMDVVAKSNRIKGILESGSKKNNDTIVGAKFTSGSPKKHIITHCVGDKILIDATDNIDKVISIIRDYFGDSICYHDIENINNNKYKQIFKSKSKYDISKTRFVNIVVDAYYLEKFDVERDTSELQDNAIITLYDTGTKTSDIMKQLDINFLDVRIIDETTILLRPDQYNKLKDKAPYLISMAVSDISLLEKEDICKTDDAIITIPEPSNEPTIGVIDTMFDENVYFSKWVEFKNMLDSEI